MQESDVHLFCTWTWLLVDEADALTFTLYECFSHTVFNGKCYVVNTLATLLEELGNSTFGACRLQQFEFHFTYLQEGSLYFLVSYFFNVVALQSECVLKVREHLINALDSDAQMVNTRNFHTEFWI